MRFRLFFLLFPIFFYLSVGLIDDYIFLVTNSLIMIFSLFGVFYRENQYYSLSKIFFLFSFFFFGIVPYLDYLSGNYYWGGSQIDNFYYSLGNIMILIYMSFFLFSYILFGIYTNKKISNQLLLYSKSYEIVKIKKASIILILLSLLTCSFILYYNNFNFLLIMMRGVVMELESSNLNLFSSAGSSLVYQYIISPFPIIILLAYNYISDLSYRKYHRKVFLLILFILSIIFVFPTSSARFLIISLYLALLLSFSNILKVKYLFQFSFIGGLLIVFPFLDKFRRFDIETFNFSLDFSFMQDGHFDAYQNFIRLLSIDYVTYGYQFLGPILFYFPRSIWNDKPIGSGHLLSEIESLTFNNISFPLIAEFYINFSLIGIIIFSILLGFIVRLADDYYWNLRFKLNTHWYYNFYHLSLGLFFFISRGDLMSSFAYSFTILGSYLILVLSLRYFFLRRIFK